VHVTWWHVKTTYTVVVVYVGASCDREQERHARQELPVARQVLILFVQSFVTGLKKPFKDFIAGNKWMFTSRSHSHTGVFNSRGHLKILGASRVI
jgi:hypothetical protein